MTRAERVYRALLRAYPRSTREACGEDMVQLLVVIVALAQPGYYEPLFDDRMVLAGLPFGMAVLALAAILAMVGILAARRNDDLVDPWVQVVLLAGVLVSFPVMRMVEGFYTAVATAMVMTLFVLVTRFRALMLALAVPFAVWLLFGPPIVAALLNSVGE